MANLKDWIFYFAYFWVVRISILMKLASSKLSILEEECLDVSHCTILYVKQNMNDFFHFGSGPLKFNPLFVKRIAILRNWYHTSRYRVTLLKWLYQQNTIHAFLYVNLCNFRFHDYKGHLKCWKDIKLFSLFAKISKNLREKNRLI